MQRDDQLDEAGAKPDFQASHRRKVLLVASAGGHWVQLSRLSPALVGHDMLYATTMKGTPAPIGERPVKVISDASQSTPGRVPVTVLQLMLIFVSFRPHCVISTGAAPGLLAIVLGRMLGCRTVWLDSIANSEELSRSGRMARRWADLWLTQWPHLVDRHVGLEHHGAVL